MSEFYNSSTHGSIPLSFEGRRMLQNLRYAIQGAINEALKRDPELNGSNPYGHNDNAIAKARGDLAKYLSQLEERKMRKEPTDWKHRPHKPFIEKSGWAHYSVDSKIHSLEATIARQQQCIANLEHTVARHDSEINTRVSDQFKRLLRLEDRIQRLDVAVLAKRKVARAKRARKAK